MPLTLALVIEVLMQPASLCRGMAVAEFFLLGVWLEQDLRCCFLVLLKPAKGAVSMGLIGCSCLVSEVGWSCVCVFSCSFLLMI